MRTEPARSIGERIADARKAQGLTQQTLADRTFDRNTAPFMMVKASIARNR